MKIGELNMRIKKLKEFPFQQFTKAIANNKDEAKEFFRTNKLTPSLMSQVYAYIATLKNFKYTDKGLIDGSTYLKDNFEGDAWHIGLYYMLITDPRGNLFPGIKQTGKDYLPYCGLVPLILAAHKSINDITYETWDKTTLGQLVNKSLLEVMELSLQEKYQFTSEELLEARNEGLYYISGVSAGKQKSPETTFKLNGLVSKQENGQIMISSEFTQDLPSLAQTILTQIWAAHPVNRNNLMILDLYDWDNIPEPLEDTKVLIKSKSIAEDELDLPWNH